MYKQFNEHGLTYYIHIPELDNTYDIVSCTPIWTKVADENGSYTVSKWTMARYGKNEWVYSWKNGTIKFDNDTWTDPEVGTVKEGDIVQSCNLVISPLPEITYTYEILKTLPLVTNTISIYGDSSKGSTSGEGNYFNGDFATINVIPNSDVEFSGWYEDSLFTKLFSYEKKYTFKVTKNLNLYPRLLRKYNVNLFTNIPGSGEVRGSGEYLEKDTVTIEAIPNDGYSFVGWYSDQLYTNLVTTNKKYTFIINNNVKYYAKFIINYKLSVDVSYNGYHYSDFSGFGVVTVKINDEVVARDKTSYYGEISGGSRYNVEFTCDEKYWFSDKSSSKIIGGIISQDTTVTIILVDKIYVEFEADPIKAGGTTSGTGYYKVGEIVSGTAIPATGAKFQYWSTDEYIPLEYIESTGGQLIDTGIVSNGQNLFSLEYSISEYDSNSWNVIMSTCNSLSETLIGSIKDELGVKLFEGPLNKLAGDFNKHILKYDNGYRFDGNLIESGNKYTNENYLLFGSDKYEYGCKGRIYDLLFYKNYFLVGTKEIMHLIPVMKRSNNEVGMLDIYNNKLIFYPNIGTGEFIAGPQKELELRSYDNPISIEVGKSNMKFTAYFKKRYRKILIGE